MGAAVRMVRGSRSCWDREGAGAVGLRPVLPPGARNGSKRSHNPSPTYHVGHRFAHGRWGTSKEKWVIHSFTKQGLVTSRLYRRERLNLGQFFLILLF